MREIHFTEAEKYMLQNQRNTYTYYDRQSAGGVRKGIRQTEFCHYFRTRAFAGTEGLDVLRLTQGEDLVGTA